MTQTAAPAWQRGYALEELRAYAEPFKASDKGLVLGAFTGFKERDVAAALAAGQLRSAWDDGRPVACLVCRIVRQSQGLRDFTGELRERMWAGDVQVSRIGALPGYEEQARGLLAGVAAGLGQGSTIFVHSWVESEQHREILRELPLNLVAVKIPASSELIAIHARTKGRPNLEKAFTPLQERDRWGLRRLDLRIPDEEFRAAVEALARVPEYAQHYSSYNKGRAWSALSLRGYSDDPGFIVKPAEMSKRWKEQNPYARYEAVRNTPLRAQLPELEPLIEMIPGLHQRIRLMQLDPGGGELTRHADITDPEAGTLPGEKVMRIHLPLITNPDVRFSSWELDGRRYERNMAEQEAWYLDTRKPHTAINGGATPRVHLVVDAYSSPKLIGMLQSGGS